MNARKLAFRMVVVVLLGVLSTVLFGSSSVSAVSPYDDLIKTTDNPVLREINGNAEYDTAVDFLVLKKIIQAEYDAAPSWDKPQFYWYILFYLDQILEHNPSAHRCDSAYGNWMLIKEEDYWGTGDVLRIVFSGRGIDTVEFRSDAGIQYVHTNGMGCESGSPSAMVSELGPFAIDKSYVNANNPLGIRYLGSYPTIWYPVLQVSSSPALNASAFATTHPGHGYLGNYKIILSTYRWNYPSGYEGELVIDGADTDNDGDGLNAIQEIRQGTSDSNPDTDNDGISDFKESIWFPDRDEVFCDTSATPHECAYPDPLVQDIYVEVDWMKDPVTNRTFKPTNTQIGLVKTMFANEGVNLHVDTGQFGGGNELADYEEYLRQEIVSGVPDFLNYKYGGDGISRNFAAKRQGIWRYMIYGNKYATDDGNSTSSGWAAVLGDSVFISGGVVEGITGVADNDRVVANTIAHELGHSLCLSPVRVYFEQSASCVFAGIDNRSGKPPTNDPDSFYHLADYKSVMNYRYQLTDDDDMGTVDYSHGARLPDDHDDWSAIKANVGGFSGSHIPYVEFGARMSKRSLKVVGGYVIAESTPIDARLHSGYH